MLRERTFNSRNSSKSWQNRGTFWRCFPQTRLSKVWKCRWFNRPTPSVSSTHCCSINSQTTPPTPHVHNLLHSLALFHRTPSSLEMDLSVTSADLFLPSFQPPEFPHIPWISRFVPLSITILLLAKRPDPPPSQHPSLVFPFQGSAAPLAGQTEVTCSSTTSHKSLVMPNLCRCSFPLATSSALRSSLTGPLTRANALALWVSTTQQVHRRQFRQWTASRLEWRDSKFNWRSQEIWANPTELFGHLVRHSNTAFEDTENTYFFTANDNQLLLIILYTPIHGT